MAIRLCTHVKKKAVIFLQTVCLITSFASLQSAQLRIPFHLSPRSAADRAENFIWRFNRLLDPKYEKDLVTFINAGIHHVYPETMSISYQYEGAEDLLSFFSYSTSEERMNRAYTTLQELMRHKNSSTASPTIKKACVDLSWVLCQREQLTEWHTIKQASKLNEGEKENDEEWVVV